MSYHTTWFRPHPELKGTKSWSERTLPEPVMCLLVSTLLPSLCPTESTSLLLQHTGKASLHMSERGVREPPGPREGRKGSFAAAAEGGSLLLSGAWGGDPGIRRQGRKSRTVPVTHLPLPPTLPSLILFLGRRTPRHKATYLAYNSRSQSVTAGKSGARAWSGQEQKMNVSSLPAGFPAFLHLCAGKASLPTECQRPQRTWSFYNN